MSNNKTRLQDYLLKYGKTHTWSELGKEFGVTAEVARHLHRKISNNNILLKENKLGEKISDDIKRDLSDNTEAQNYIGTLEDTIVNLIEDLNNGTSEITANSNQPIQNLEDLIRVCKIDTSIWNIDKYIQNFWGDKFQVKAFLSKRTQQQDFTQEFTEFLSNYNPKERVPILRQLIKYPNNSCMIINKQDIHWNKHDLNGDNDIDKRFQDTYLTIQNNITKSILTSNLDKIYYIVGSDEFNSEWTNMTTKGTPQKNILSYQEAFERICNYEISIIETLLESGSDIEVIYIPGNHDEYVGWHLIHFLEAEFKEVNNISFDISTEYTKYRRYGNSAFMFNHGDAIKPEKLAQIFPVEFKREWGKCDNFYIMIGDRHHNHYKDLNGIEFYQLPAMSKAQSNWDKKNGYTSSSSKMVTFVVSNDNGITDIYHNKM